MKRLIAVILILPMLAGCASVVRFHPVIEPDSKSETLLANGNEVVFSYEDSTTVALFMQTHNVNELLLHVFYLNNSNSRIDVYPEDIVVEYFDDYILKKDSLYVYPSDIYMQRIRNAQNMQNVAVALNAAAAAMNTSQTTTTTGSVGGSNVNLQSTTNDPTRGYLIMNQASNQIDSNNIQNATVNISFESSLLKRNTLFPGMFMEGNVITTYRTSDYYDIYVPIKDDIHHFRFNAEVVETQSQSSAPNSTWAEEWGE